MAFVEFRDVRKVYRMGEVEVAAVDGMTFDIEQGEFVVVVGPSGSGTTTLLGVLAGLTRPDLTEARRAVERIYGPEAPGIWTDLLSTARLEGSERDQEAIDRLLDAMRAAAPVTALCGEALAIRVASYDRLVQAHALMGSGTS